MLILTVIYNLENRVKINKHGVLLFFIESTYKCLRFFKFAYDVGISPRNLFPYNTLKQIQKRQLRYAYLQYFLKVI